VTQHDAYETTTTTVAQEDMPHTKEQMKRRRAEAGDEGRANDAARKKRQRAEVGDELKRSKNSKLCHLIKSRVMRLADLDIAADDASLEKLNLEELNDLKKSLDKH
jgi:hypothetical protein